MALAGRDLGPAPTGPLTSLDSGRLAAWTISEFAVGSDIFGFTSDLFGGISTFSTGLGALVPLGTANSFSKHKNRNTSRVSADDKMESILGKNTNSYGMCLYDDTKDQRFFQPNHLFPPYRFQKSNSFVVLTKFSQSAAM